MVKFRDILIITILILVATTTSGCVYLEPSQNVDVTLQPMAQTSNETSKHSCFDTVPTSMKREMTNKALADVYNDTSTLESIKMICRR